MSFDDDGWWQEESEPKAIPACSMLTEPRSHVKLAHDCSAMRWSRLDLRVTGLYPPSDRRSRRGHAHIQTGAVRLCILALSLRVWFGVLHELFGIRNGESTLFSEIDG